VSAKIVVNGQARDLPSGATVATLLRELGLAGRGGIAVEVNAEVIPKSEHAARALAEGDRIEVVTMIAGG
jgi:sulfur carrier protein